MTIRMSRSTATLIAIVLSAGAVAAQGQAASTWLDNREAIEQCLRTSPVERAEDVPVGVTKPKKVFFQPGATIPCAAWKPLAPNRYQGFWESYKSEIAAYELDKLLQLNMVPPTVERTYKGDKGAAVMWIEGVKTWDRKATLTPPNPEAWSRQVCRMKMFDQLIANIDRNQGNLLYDESFRLILIDHSRAFTGVTDIRKMAELVRVDFQLWERMKALTLEELEASIGQWVPGKGELRAILKRRDAMQRQIDKLVKERGADNVFYR